MKFGLFHAGFGCPEHGDHIISKLAYPVAGQVVTEDLPPDMPELRACNEIFVELAKHRRLPEDLLEELERRMDRLSEVLVRRVRLGIARYN